MYSFTKNSKNANININSKKSLNNMNNSMKAR